MPLIWAMIYFVAGGLCLAEYAHMWSEDRRRADDAKPAKPSAKTSEKKEAKGDGEED